MMRVPQETTGEPRRKRRLAFVLLPKFSLVTLGCATEPFRLANQRSPDQPFTYRLLGIQPGEVETSDGLRMSTDELVGESDDWDIVFLISSLVAVDFEDHRFSAWLRRLARAGVPLAPLGAATVLAARLGLLDDHRCVTHFRLYASFIEKFPRVRLERGLYCIDRRRLTCAGGFAAMDLGLQLVSEVVTPEVALEVAEIAMMSRIRSGGESQRMSVHWRYGVADRRVETAIETMEANLERPLPLTEIATAAGVSQRQLRRLFVAELGRLPHRHYLETRLRRGHELLVDTDQPVLSVALKCGFADAAQFSRTYREIFGETPTTTRAGARRGHAEGHRGE